MPNTTLTIDQLALSPLNVRTYSPDAEDTTALQASILADGLLNPIAVHPMKGNKGKWGAIAGGRRYRAIRALIGNGDLPANYAVKVTILEELTDAELIEHSITENLIRRDLRDHELWAGVARAAARGHAVEQIAKGIGQSNLALVSRWLRLGRLEPSIFAAFSRGEITGDQAKAFAATEDQDLQQVTFERLAPINIHVPTPAEIRKAMKIGDARAQRDLAFVGADAYRAAGGRFELDLFAEAAEERGRIVDEGKLQQLVEEKLAEVRATVRTTTGQPDLRFIAEKPTDQWGSIDHQLIVSPKPAGPGKLDLPSADVVAHIAIDAAGQPIVSYWWESRKAKFGTEKRPSAVAQLATPAPRPAQNPFDAKQRADATLRQGDGISQDAGFALRALRKTILRAALIDDAGIGGDVALDYLVWAQARTLLAEQRPVGIGMRGIASDSSVGVSREAMELARELAAPTPAAKGIASAIARIQSEPFFTDPDPAAAFRAYHRDADPVLKNRTAAVVAGLALERSLATDGYDMPIHDLVAHEAGTDRDGAMRLYWTPTADFLDLFPKDQRVGIAEPYVDRATFLTWAKLKSSDLTSNVLAVVTRAGSKGASWVHPLLRFTSPFLADQAEAAEAAE
jgi:ParB family chromosome partitioning protein